MERLPRTSGPVPRDRTRILSAWLLLLSILVHALVPVGSPLVRGWGSAFSAGTVDVSLAGSRKSEKSTVARAVTDGAADVAADDPPGTALAGETRTPAPALIVDDTVLVVRSGPPLSAAARTAFKARAPPFA